MKLKKAIRQLVVMRDAEAAKPSDATTYEWVCGYIEGLDEAIEVLEAVRHG